MAQGASWLFGVRLMENFNLPYAATSVRDFWRRWHISLSSWFRDYLYIPLGGNQKGAVRTYFNLAFTMLVCGFWHGANWTFLLWGAIHGTMLILERATDGYRGLNVPKFLAWPLTLVFVLLAWVPFRAPDIVSTGKVYLAIGNGGWEWPSLAFVCGLLGIVMIDLYYHWVGRKTYISTAMGETSEDNLTSDWHAAFMLGFCILIWCVLHVLGENKVASFIYFQF